MSVIPPCYVVARYLCELRHYSAGEPIKVVYVGRSIEGCLVYLRSAPSERTHFFAVWHFRDDEPALVQVDRGRSIPYNLRPTALANLADLDTQDQLRRQVVAALIAVPLP